MSPDALKDVIIQLLDDKKAENIHVIDLQKITSFTSFMVFATGRSSKNISSIAYYVADELKKAGHPHIGLEGLGKSDWVLMDAGDVIVHLFEPQAREYYKLEELWSEPKS